MSNLDQLMIERQKRYFKKLEKDYYMPHELMNILEIPYNEAKNATYGLVKAEKGYSKLGIIINFMGGMLYSGML